MTRKNINKLAILCGGFAYEAGISLNSARSVLDHMPNIQIHVFYLHPVSAYQILQPSGDRDGELCNSTAYLFQTFRVYKISNDQLYSNTPQDFAYQLKNKPALSQEDFSSHLQSMDVIFPLIHGPVGEDGVLQSYLDSLGVKYLGADAVSAKRMFNKVWCNAYLQCFGFPVNPYKIIRSNPISSVGKLQIHKAWAFLAGKEGVAKPSAGGSSIGVRLVHSLEDLTQTIIEHRQLGFFESIVEPRIIGTEFTILVLCHKGNPIALIPSSIHMKDKAIFDYRSKYLPTLQTFWQTPGNFSYKVIQKIRHQAQDIFTAFHARDFVRMDGFVQTDQSKKSKESTIIFSDINVISGMEQTSFLFQQAAAIGMTQADVLSFLMDEKLGKNDDSLQSSSLNQVHHDQSQQIRQNVAVVFGGKTSERQVSVTSGTNVFLKLQQSTHVIPFPYLLDKDDNIWGLPMVYVLNHTVEEILLLCHKDKWFFEQWQMISNEVCTMLSIPLFVPKRPQCLSLDQWIDVMQTQHQFCFIALHGGIGENGDLQHMLEKKGIAYNGSDSRISKICSSKYKTGDWITQHHIPYIDTLPKVLFSVQKDIEDLSSLSFPMVIKPVDDGCSIGIAILYTRDDMVAYIQAVRSHDLFLPAETLNHQKNMIELSSDSMMEYILEPYIFVDKVLVDHDVLTHVPKQGYIELTVGFLEHKGDVVVFLPSLPIASSSILSLEEKFQGGTGINLTPPPEDLLTADQRTILQTRLKRYIQIFGLRNYGRLDMFYHLFNEHIIIIEVNTLPGLTPSTVFFQQALCAGFTPLHVLEHIIKTAKQDHHSKL